MWSNWKGIELQQTCCGRNAGKDLAREKDGIGEAESGFDHAMIFNSAGDDSATGNNGSERQPDG
jgi:hypothetical protein